MQRIYQWSPAQSQSMGAEAVATPASPELFLPGEKAESPRPGLLEMGSRLLGFKFRRRDLESHYTLRAGGSSGNRGCYQVTSSPTPSLRSTTTNTSVGRVFCGDLGGCTGGRRRDRGRPTKRSESLGGMVRKANPAPVPPSVPGARAGPVRKRYAEMKSAALERQQQLDQTPPGAAPRGRYTKLSEGRRSKMMARVAASQTSSEECGEQSSDTVDASEVSIRVTIKNEEADGGTVTGKRSPCPGPPSDPPLGPPPVPMRRVKSAEVISAAPAVNERAIDVDLNMNYCTLDKVRDAQRDVRLEGYPEGATVTAEGHIRYLTPTKFTSRGTKYASITSSASLKDGNDTLGRMSTLPVGGTSPPPCSPPPSPPSSTPATRKVQVVLRTRRASVAGHVELQREVLPCGEGQEPWPELPLRVSLSSPRSATAVLRPGVMSAADFLKPRAKRSAAATEPSTLLLPGKYAAKLRARRSSVAVCSTAPSAAPTPAPSSLSRSSSLGRLLPPPPPPPPRTPTPCPPVPRPRTSKLNSRASLRASLKASTRESTRRGSVGNESREPSPEDLCGSLEAVSIVLSAASCDSSSLPLTESV